ASRFDLVAHAYLLTSDAGAPRRGPHLSRTTPIPEGVFSILSPPLQGASRAIVARTPNDGHGRHTRFTGSVESVRRSYILYNRASRRSASGKTDADPRRGPDRARSLPARTPRRVPFLNRRPWRRAINRRGAPQRLP